MVGVGSGVGAGVGVGKGVFVAVGLGAGVDVVVERVVVTVVVEPVLDRLCPVLTRVGARVSALPQTVADGGAIRFLQSCVESGVHGCHGTFVNDVRKLMDEVRFEFVPGQGNTLTMIKRTKTD